jgi:DMSO reductase family type II enzyme chaperone
MSGPTSTRTRFDAGQEEALCRAAVYRALSIGLSMPSAERLEQITSSDARLALAEAWPGSSITAWIGTWNDLTLDNWRTDHARLFGHTARGTACPYESEYGIQGLFSQPRQLASIMGFYHAFGLEISGGERERADHVSCELEFLEFLSRREAAGVQCEETRNAMRLFLREHTARFGFAFARLLKDNSGGGFYGALGAVLEEFLSLECRRLEIEPGLPLLPLRPAEEADVPIACGSREELIQISS